MNERTHELWLSVFERGNCRREPNRSEPEASSVAAAFREFILGNVVPLLTRQADDDDDYHQPPPTPANTATTDY